MTENFKWLYFDLDNARYVDNDGAEDYILSNPESTLIEVTVDINNPISSGIGVGLIPETYTSKIREDGILYELQISGSNIIISSSGVEIQKGFLPLSGGVLTGSLVLSGNPQIPLEAATKEYVDQTGYLNVITVSGNYSLSNEDQVILCNNNSEINLTLPTISGNIGKQFKIKKISNNGYNVVISGNNPLETIDGDDNLIIEFYNSAVTLINDEESWYIF